MSWLFLIFLAQPDPRQVREDLQEILERPEFKENLPTDFFENLRDYLKLEDVTLEPPRLKPPRMPSVSPWIMKTLAIVVVVSIVSFIIVMLFRAWARKSFEDLIPPVTVEAKEAGPVNALSQPARQWADDADLLFRQGKVAEAIRALYLAILSSSHRRSWIDYHPGKTNGEYLRRFEGPGEAQALLTAFTRLYERKWYGRESCTEQDYRESRRLTDDLLAMERTAS